METIEENSVSLHRSDRSELINPTPGDKTFITKKEDNEEFMVGDTTDRNNKIELRITAIFVQNTLEVLVPFLVDCINNRMGEKQPQDDQVLARSELEEQMYFDAYTDTIDDMSEIIIQCGYVPITRLLTIINNIFEMKVDAYNLIHQSQRPDPDVSSGLVAWSTLLGFFSIVAVATNVWLLIWSASVVEYLTLLPSDNSALEFKLIFFNILSVLLALIVAFERWIIHDIPLYVEQAIERQRLPESVLVFGATDADKDTPSEDDDEDFDFDSKAETIDVSSLVLITETNLRLGGGCKLVEMAKILNNGYQFEFLSNLDKVNNVVLGRHHEEQTKIISKQSKKRKTTKKTRPS